MASGEYESFFGQKEVEEEEEEEEGEEREGFVIKLFGTSDVDTEEVRGFTRLYLELTYYKDERDQALNNITALTTTLMKDGGPLEECVTEIAIFLLSNSEENLYVCWEVVNELFKENRIVWEVVEMMLMISFMEDFYKTELGELSCPLILLISKVDFTLLDNVLNFLANGLRSRRREVKRRSIKLCLSIFTSDNAHYATKFYKLWHALCQSMMDKRLDSSIFARFTAAVLTKQPKFRTSFYAVLKFQLKFRRLVLSEDVYGAIADAVAEDRSVFLNDSYLVTLIKMGTTTKKRELQAVVLLSLGRIFEANLFTHHVFRDEGQERRWEENNAALLRTIFHIMDWTNAPVSSRSFMKDVLFKYVFPTRMPEEMRANHLLKTWLEMSTSSRKILVRLAKNSCRVRLILSEMLHPSQNTSYPMLLKRMVCCVGSKMDATNRVHSFLLTEKVSDLVRTFFLEDTARDASRSIEIAERILGMSQLPGREEKILKGIITYASNGWYDRETLLTLLDEMMHITNVDKFDVALQLVENILQETPVAFLHRAVFQKLTALAAAVGRDVSRIFLSIADIPELFTRVDVQMVKTYHHMLLLAKREAARLDNK